MVSFKLAVAVFLFALVVGTMASENSGSASREVQKNKRKHLVTKGCAGLAPTNEPSTPPPPTESTQPPIDVTYDCPLVQALITISINLIDSGDDDADEFKSLVIDIQIKFDEIDNDPSVPADKKEDKKLHHAAYKLKNHFKKHPKTKKKCEYMEHTKDCNGNRYGYIRDVIYIVIEVQMENSGPLTILDANDDCPLFEALRNASQNSTDPNIQQQCGVDLIADLKAVLKCGCGHSHEQEADLHFKIITKNYPQCDNFFLSIDDDDFFPGFGRYESFRDVVRVEHLTVNIQKVLSGENDDDNVFLGALEQLIINVTIDVQIRSQIKGIHDWCQSLFNATTDMQTRLHNVSYVIYQFRLQCPWLPSVLFSLEITSPDGEWEGDIYDLFFTSNACSNLGSCSCVNAGPALPTTPAPPTTTTQSTTTTTSQCAGRADVTVRDGAGNSDLLISISQVSISWSATWNMSFSPTWNKLKKVVLDDTTICDATNYPITCNTPANKVNCVKYQAVTASTKGYPWYPSFAAINIKRFHLDSSVWGTITNYCNCPDM